MFLCWPLDATQCSNDRRCGLCVDRTTCVARSCAQGHYDGCWLDRVVPAANAVYDIHGDGAADWGRVGLDYVSVKARVDDIVDHTASSPPLNQRGCTCHPVGLGERIGRRCSFAADRAEATSCRWGLFRFTQDPPVISCS